MVWYCEDIIVFYIRYILHSGSSNVVFNVMLSYKYFILRKAGSESLQVLIICLYMHCRWRSSYQVGRTWIPLTGLTLPRLCAYPKPTSCFPMSYVVVFFCVQWVKMRCDYSFCWYWWYCDHHCLNFLTFWFTCALSRHTAMLHGLHLPFDILEQCGVSFGTGITVSIHNNKHQTCS